MAGVTGGHRLKAFLRKAARAQAGSVKSLEVGFFDSARYPDGEAVTNVAAKNEFGSKTEGIPERPFFRNAIKGAEEELIGIVKAHINTRTLAPTTRLAGLLGESLKDRIQRSITTLRTPPNSAATIKAKGSSNPLIETTFMHNSVDYKIS